MTLEKFKKYLIEERNIYPDFCGKEKIKYNGYDIYYPDWDDKDIGLPMFYLVDRNDNIIKCDEKQMYEILDLFS